MRACAPGKLQPRHADRSDVGCRCLRGLRQTRNTTNCAGPLPPIVVVIRNIGIIRERGLREMLEVVEQACRVREASDVDFHLPGNAAMQRPEDLEQGLVRRF